VHGTTFGHTASPDQRRRDVLDFFAAGRRPVFLVAFRAVFRVVFPVDLLLVFLVVFLVAFLEILRVEVLRVEVLRVEVLREVRFSVLAGLLFFAGVLVFLVATLLFFVGLRVFLAGAFFPPPLDVPFFSNEPSAAAFSNHVAFGTSKNIRRRLVLM
jgi:hypothetical protein